MAIGVHAGLPPGSALSRSDAIAEAVGTWPATGADADAVAEATGFARDAGIPLAALLQAEADRMRRVELAAATARASALGTRLLLPLGVCVLPAFMLVGVLPIGVAVFASTRLAM